MQVDETRIRAYRLHAHHLDRALPKERLTAAAGACGIQNSPPGAWETAMYQRVAGCSIDDLRQALETDRTLLQAWSIRGVPLVFPTAESEIFLSPLIAQKGEEPWVYTRGIALALEYLGMEEDVLRPLVMQAAGWLEQHTVSGKEALDETLAALVSRELPEEKRALWSAPSMYGHPDRQTVGGAVVPFLLRPCSFCSRVVFGKRQGACPEFTSYVRWIGRPPEKIPDAGRRLVRKFLRCYGPTTLRAFADWTGCSPAQATRLWDGVREELCTVQVNGKLCSLLEEEREALQQAETDGDRLLLLGSHDPYLDLRDRWVLLPDPARQRQVWKTVGNPGTILRGGRIIGIWTAKSAGERLDIALMPFEMLREGEAGRLRELVEEYAVFQKRSVRRLDM